MTEPWSRESGETGLRDLGNRPAVITPSYLTLADHPWLRAVLDERERFVGRRRREWRVRVTIPFPVPTPASKLRVALGVLDRLAQDRAKPVVLPRRLRAAVFRAATKSLSRAQALEHAADEFDITVGALLDGLFSDLPNERPLEPLTAALDPSAFAVLCNEAIVSSLLHRALSVRVLARGNVRAVVRHAKLVGLLCLARLGPAADDVTLDLSGPYALFRHTRIYGRALASLVPRLARCNSFRLEADCVMGKGEPTGRLVLRSGDPIASARELPRFDSLVEQRFARDFGKLALEWDVVREPVPIVVGDALTFPDFELRHRTTGQRWLLEIVGYWTPEYLTRKLATLQQMQCHRLIVCIDEERSCADGTLEELSHVVRYKRRLDPRPVIAIIDPLLASILEPSARSKRK